jgi:C-terminal processing protease CtpA/Prc
LAAGTEADVVVERAGAPEPQTVKVTLSGGPVTLGVSWREDEAEPSSVLLTRVIAGSPADRAGLKARDRIYQVDGADFAGGDELLRYVRQATGELELLVETSGRLRTVEVELLPRLEPLVVPTP